MQPAPALSGRESVLATTQLTVHLATAELGHALPASVSGLGSGRAACNIGALVPVISRWFHASMLQGIRGSLMEKGYETTLHQLTMDRGQRDKASLVSFCASTLRRRSP